MGTPSSKKFFKNNAGITTEEAALLTSAGAADANRIPALNANGVLDASIVNSTVTSAGAADSGKPVALDAGGHLDLTVLPSGVGPDTAIIVASETLAAGDWVNVWNDAGAFKVRKADATTAGKEVHGFVLAGAAAAGNATVYFVGTNTGVTGQTPGPVYLGTTAGQGQATAPTGSGNVVQTVGVAISATAVNFATGNSFFVLA